MTIKSIMNWINKISNSAPLSDQIVLEKEIEQKKIYPQFKNPDEPTYTNLQPKLIATVNGIDLYEIPLSYAKGYLVSQQGHVAKTSVYEGFDPEYTFINKRNMHGTCAIGIHCNGNVKYMTRNRIMMITFKNIQDEENWIVKKIDNAILDNRIDNLIWRKHKHG